MSVYLFGKHIFAVLSDLSSLPPANEVCEGYVFTPVSQSFCSQGRVSVPVHAGIPPGPEADTPHDQRQTPPHDQRQTTPGPEADPPPFAVYAGRYGQQAGGTHPTGMQSCLL